MAEAGIPMVPGTQNLKQGREGVAEALVFRGKVWLPDNAQGHLGGRRSGDSQD